MASNCLTDTFEVTNPGGVTPPTICGTNTGEHSTGEKMQKMRSLQLLLPWLKLFFLFYILS